MYNINSVSIIKTPKILIVYQHRSVSLKYLKSSFGDKKTQEKYHSLPVGAVHDLQEPQSLIPLLCTTDFSA